MVRDGREDEICIVIYMTGEDRGGDHKALFHLKQRKQAMAARIYEAGLVATVPNGAGVKENDDVFGHIGRYRHLFLHLDI